MITLATARVLIVDDNRNMRFIVREVLNAVGVTRVTEAANAREALSITNRFYIDLAIIDWQMAPIDGIALTKMIRNGAAGPNAKARIVMMTAHTEHARVAAARDAGVHGMICKPITAQQLLDRVSKAFMDNRPFVRTDNFFGPDRRRCAQPGYAGPFRRASDVAEDDSFVLDDAPIRAWG